MNIYVSCIVICFIVSTLLFRKAAGTLNIGKLNVISCIYYLFMLQTFVGISLIMLGYNKHYTLNYLLNRDRSCEITFWAVMFCSVIFPLFIFLWLKIFRIKPSFDYKNYLRKKTETGKDWISFGIICIISVVALIMLVIFLRKIGYVPLLMFVHAPEGFSMALERTRISGMYIFSPIITNILVLTMIPLLSYMAFSYALTFRTKKWCVLSAVLFLASLVVKTYKFEKSPVLFYIMVFVLIYVYSRGGINQTVMLVIGGVLLAILLVIYRIMGYSGDFLDIYNGVLGRTLFTEVGTLAYAFDLFPGIFGFLGGRSLSPTVLKLLGKDSALHLRSAKLVMEFYGADKVYDGTAGVMNTHFMGEAYANWGYSGVLFSMLWVAFIVSLVFSIVLKLRKTPISIAYLAVMTVRLATTTQGGFVDFIYNFDLLLTTAMFLGGYLVAESNVFLNIRNRVEDKIKEMSGAICSTFRK